MIVHSEGYRFKKSCKSVSVALQSDGQICKDFNIALYKAIVADVDDNGRATFLAIARRCGADGREALFSAMDRDKRYTAEPPMVNPITRQYELPICVEPLFESTSYLYEELLPSRRDEDGMRGTDQAAWLARSLGTGADTIAHERAVLILACRELLKCAKSGIPRGELGAIAALALGEPRSLLEPPARVALHFLVYHLCRLLDRAGCSQLRRLGDVAPLTADSLRELSPLIFAGFRDKAVAEAGSSADAYTAVPAQPSEVDLDLVVGLDAAPDDWESLC